MASTGRIPLWLVGLVGGLAAMSLLFLFFYGAVIKITSCLY